MLLTRLYLRNFRVYEDELDLALPPGLVGVYGPNGAGKSTLLEGISFTLWGKARTGREEIRSAGVGADCVTEVEFEHEGHLYLVRRVLTGINATMRAEALCDGLLMAEGATDTRRYVHSVLGMDDTAFKASVFAEQKQLAAFSSQAPADRRRLVLQLLGITPLDTARDAVRRDARDHEARLAKLRSMLPDLGELRVSASDAEAAAAAAEAEAGADAAAAEQAATAEAAARAAWQQHDQLRQAYDGLVIEGRAAKATLDRAVEAVDRFRAELADLDTAAEALAAAAATAAGLDDDRRRLQAVRAALDAARRLEATALGPPPDPPDAAATTALAAEAAAAGEARASVAGRRQAAEAERDRAEAAVSRSASLSSEEACPLCGQALGDAFAAVQEHRAAELEAACDRVR